MRDRLRISELRRLSRKAQAVSQQGEPASPSPHILALRFRRVPRNRDTNFEDHTTEIAGATMELVLNKKVLQPYLIRYIKHPILNLLVDGASSVDEGLQNRGNHVSSKCSAVSCYSSSIRWPDVNTRLNR